MRSPQPAGRRHYSDACEEIATIQLPNRTPCYFGQPWAGV